MPLLSPRRYQQATRDRAKVKTEGGQIIRVEAHPIPGERAISVLSAQRALQGGRTARSLSRQPRARLTPPPLSAQPHLPSPDFRPRLRCLQSTPAPAV